MAARVSTLPGVSWLLAWTDPLHLARRLLLNSIEQRAHYATGRLLDIGCGYQPYRNLFGDQLSRYIGMEIEPRHGPDVRGDAIALPFAGGVFDTVLCTEVAEHVPEPVVLFAELARVLKPGGTVLLTTPQTWGLHHEPHDYYRYTKYGLRYLAVRSGLDVLEVSPTCGLWATVAQRVADTVVHTYAVRRSRWVIRVLSLSLAPVLLAGFLLDRLFGKRGDTLDNVLVARKPMAGEALP